MPSYTLTTKNQRKKGKKCIHHCNKNNKIPGNKPTWGDKSPVFRKLEGTTERSQRQTNKKIYHVLGSEETMWKWLNYPKQSTG